MYEIGDSQFKISHTLKNVPKKHDEGILKFPWPGHNNNKIFSNNN